MSTKTNFKRIALVAIAALGLSVLSSVPAKAVGNLSVTVTNGTFVAGLADSTNAATIAVSATLEDIKDTITVTVVGNGTLGDSVVASSSRVARVIYLDTSTATRTKVGDGTITAPTNVLTAMAGNSQYDSNMVNATNTYHLSGSSVGNVGATFGIQVDSVASTVIAGTYSFTVFVKQYTQGVSQPVTSDGLTKLPDPVAVFVSILPTSEREAVEVSK